MPTPDNVFVPSASSMAWLTAENLPERRRTTFAPAPLAAWLVACRVEEDGIGRERVLEGREDAREHGIGIREDRRDYFVARSLVEKGGCRLRVSRARRLPEPHGHRLVAHERLVLRQKLRQLVEEPAPDPAVAPDDLAGFAEPQAVVHVAFEVLEHAAEPDHCLARFLPRVPRGENLLRSRHGGGCRPAHHLAPCGCELPAALGLARIVEGPPEPSEVAHQLALHPVALHGIGELRELVPHRDSDVNHRAGAQQEGIERRIELLVGLAPPEPVPAAELAVGALSHARTVGVDVEVLPCVGFGLAVGPAVVVRVPVGRVLVCPLRHCCVIALKSKGRCFPR